MATQDELWQVIDDYKIEINILKEKHESLLVQRDFLVKALEFYANKDNWYFEEDIERMIISDNDGEGFKIDDESKYLDVIGGKLARETLAKIQGEKL